MQTGKKKYIDLHLHTTMSDGSQTPEEVIEEAKKEGLSAIALTDHNCFAIKKTNVIEGLEIIPGCEFSVRYETKYKGAKEIHVVGLFFDRVPDEIYEIFKNIDKDAYAHAILEKLHSLGIEITWSDLEKRYPEAKQFGRPHIAKLLVKKGYAKDFDEAMDRRIGNYSPYYLNPIEYMGYENLDVGVNKIIECGGFPILAHPYHYKFSDDEIEQMVADFRGITDQPLGMEVYYRDYRKKQIRNLEQLAEKYNLLPSAGSDRHFPEKTPFARGKYELLQKMKQEIN